MPHLKRGSPGAPEPWRFYQITKSVASPSQVGKIGLVTTRDPDHPEFDPTHQTTSWGTGVMVWRARDASKWPHGNFISVGDEFVPVVPDRAKFEELLTGAPQAARDYIWDHYADDPKTTTSSKERNDMSQVQFPGYIKVKGGFVPAILRGATSAVSEVNPTTWCHAEVVWQGDLTKPFGAYTEGKDTHDGSDKALDAAREVYDKAYEQLFESVASGNKARR